ncbi:hypothetical protein GF323_03305 [Candidatus Woesearchaeota archaeon]|nr:hypothetical protein [Candidatus Woesearchaeota archaeon]
MSDIEEIRKRKLKELQERQSQAMAQQADEQQKLQQQLAQLEALVKQYLDRAALERYSNLKVAHKEKAVRLLAVLSQLIQNSQVTSKISDQQLKEILKKLEPEKREFRIRRK